MNDVRKQKEASNGVGSGELVSWPASWSLVDGSIILRATVSPKIPNIRLTCTIDTDELKKKRVPSAATGDSGQLTMY